MIEQTPTFAERQARQLDRDRRILEAAFALWTLGVLDTAQQHAASAIRIGVSASAAAAAVLMGDAATHQPGLAPILAGAALNAWVMGRCRSQAIARAVETGRPIGLAAVRDTLAHSPNLLSPPMLYVNAARNIVQGVGGPGVVRSRYAAAMNTAQPIVRAVAQRVGQRLDGVSVQGDATPVRPRATAQTPPAVADAIAEARRAFEKTGIGTRTSWYVIDRHPAAGEPNVSANAETIIETTIGMEYDAGREEGAVLEARPDAPPAPAPATVVPDVLPGERPEAPTAGEPPAAPPRTKPKLWGFRWYTIEDGRQCKPCESLNGTTLPVGHPDWGQLRPLIHHGCRCVRMNVYARPGTQLPLIIPFDMRNPDVIEAIRLRQVLMAWWQGMSG